ncbi:hypothetical protein PR048_008100 [Dryococelus australis]|uniref:Uncharacterized protein n=1 Tax=Dryococelus australis TaxID=614101 RepID=A0ABQ9HXT4_9NEOP|nr:hypothetical protein PR048_008100 [Dryococelus australis]
MSTKFHALQSMKEMDIIMKMADMTILNKKVAIGGMIFNDEMIANVLLSGLLADEYKVFVQNLREPNLTTMMVKGQLLDEEQ